MGADLSVVKGMIENMAFLKQLGITIDVFEPGKTLMNMPQQDVFMTPMGSIAAGPIFSLAELAGATLLSASIDLTKYTVVAKELTITFKRPARGDLKADLSLSEDELKKILDENEAAGGKSDAIVNVPIQDTNGTVVAEIKANYRVKKLGA